MMGGCKQRVIKACKDGLISLKLIRSNLVAEQLHIMSSPWLHNSVNACMRVYGR